MYGQGRPPSPIVFRLLSALAGWVLVCCCAASVGAEATSVRVRITWKGPDPQVWLGSIAIPGGGFSDLRLLGLDADQPGTFVNQGERILVSPRFASEESGIETMVSCKLDDSLYISLSPDFDSSKSESFKVSVVDILRRRDIEHDLGNGHTLKISRTPGDEIRIRFPRQSMVFAPNERPKIDIRATHVDAKPGSTLRARFRIRDATVQRGDVSEFWNQMDESLWTRTETVRVDENGQIAPLFGIELPIPDREGSYNLLIDLAHRLPAVGSVAKRTVHFVVVDPRRPPLYGRGKATLVDKFNPADPNWRDRLAQSTLLASKRPWSNVVPVAWEQDGTTWSRLKNNGWVAYSLSGAKPGIPHVLEVEFPAGEEQNVGVSIVEPKSNGGIDQIHCDSGVTIGDQDLMLPGVAAPQQRPKHRIVFWPKSTSPVVVISNRSREGSITFGEIRLEAFSQGLPAKLPISGNRKRMAVLDGELLQAMFLTNKDGWQSFLTAGKRLISYLRYVGYDGATINVASDGSSLYPSRFLLPTAKFDQGIFSPNRRDPFQKDVLELLLQLFDREGLVLIPSLEFATPLPALEAKLAEGPAESLGIELYDIGQRPGTDLQDASYGVAPYYNPLDKRVQKAIGQVVDEVIRRYSNHASFRGINIDCKTLGYTQLPGTAWAFDGLTINAFLGHVRQVRPAWELAGLDRTLAEQLRSEEDSELTQLWLSWRAERITRFYASLANLVGRTGDHQLFLSMTDLMLSQPWQRKLRPALPRRSTVQPVLLELGIDVASLQAIENLVVLRPNQIASLNHLSSQAVNLEVNEQDIQQSFNSKGVAASQFDYETRELQLDSFDTNGPTKKNRHTFLATTSRAGSDARRHLALSMAQHDDQWIFEGGRTLPLGQESATNSFFRVFRELPNNRFETVDFDQSGPVVARIAYEAGGAVAYFVNTSPWIAATGIQWRAPKSMTVKTIGQDSIEAVKANDLLDRWSLDVTIEPYGIYALRFDSPQVKLISCRTELPAGIRQQLSVQIDEIVSRGKQIDEPQPIQLLRDPSFEKPLSAGNDWTTREVEGGFADTDFQIKAHGSASLRLSAKSADAPMRITSHEFTAPETGRLVVSLKLRNENPKLRPPVVLRLESSQENYQPFHLFENISIGQFTEAGVSFVDLPADPNLRLRVSLELAGEGDVWVDDIQLIDKWIVGEEKKALNKIIFRAVTQESNGDLAGCYQTLSGYWPRFLLRHVPPAQIAARPQPQEIPQERPKPKNRAFDLRRFVPRLRF